MASTASGGAPNLGSLSKDPNGFSYNGGRISFRHPFGDAANFAFRDGHVERMKVYDNWNMSTRFAPVF